MSFFIWLMLFFASSFSPLFGGGGKSKSWAGEDPQKEEDSPRSSGRSSPGPQKIKLKLFYDQPPAFPDYGQEIASPLSIVCNYLPGYTVKLQSANAQQMGIPGGQLWWQAAPHSGDTTKWIGYTLLVDSSLIQKATVNRFAITDLSQALTVLDVTPWNNEWLPKKKTTAHQIVIIAQLEERDDELHREGTFYDTLYIEVEAKL